jgi:hypothetical protein
MTIHMHASIKLEAQIEIQVPVNNSRKELIITIGV